jgi:Protein of unknown function (DUF3139).
MKRRRKWIIPILIIVLYIFAFDNYLGDPSFADLFNNLVIATGIFTVLYLLINGMAFSQYRHRKGIWKWMIVFVISSIPFFTWLYVYPWTARQTYPVFIHYLAEQGKSTQDIKQYRAFPDLTQGGYSYEIQLKNDPKYEYDYSIRDGQVIFMVGKNGTFDEYTDARIQAIATQGNDLGQLSMKPVNRKLQEQKSKESAAHPISFFQRVRILR